MYSEKLSRAVELPVLPEGFLFYHLGEVVPLVGRIRPPLRSSQGVCFRLRGAVQAEVIVLFPKGLDASIYSEVGNILVSKMVASLPGVFISPPGYDLDFEFSEEMHVLAQYLHRQAHAADVYLTVAIRREGVGHV